MNKSALLGFFSSNVILMISIILALGGFESFIDIPSAIIVIGGSFSAIVMATPFKIFKSSIKETINRLFKLRKIDYNKLIEEILILAKAKKADEDSFNNAVKRVSDDFLRDAASILFWTQAEVSAREFRDLLETRSRTFIEDSLNAPKFFKTLAKFPPAYGMMGTVLGLVAILQALDDPNAKSQIGPAMAVALITTLYGIAVNNIFVIPISETMSKLAQDDLKAHQIVIEGIMLIQESKPTKYIEEKLVSYMLPSERALAAKG